MFVSGTALSNDANSPIAIEPSKRGTLDMCNIISNYNDFICIANDLDSYNTLGTDADATAKSSYDYANRMVLALPVSVPDCGWTTFSAPVPTTIPSGCKAYIVEGYNTSASTAMLRLLTPGTSIAENTGILLAASPNSVIELTITESGVVYTENLMQSSIVATKLPSGANAFVLTSGDDKVLFSKVDSNNHSTLPHSSWLKLEGDVSAENIQLSIFNQETGIKDCLNDGSANTEYIYNLHGQRLETKQSGVNIINGKKVLVK
jgi:hypothetical protein